VILLLWFGAFKFTEAEARAIEPLIGNSPFTSWLYLVADSRMASAIIGSTEIGTALLIALRPLSALASAVGSVLAIGTFSTTISFLVTTPGTFVWVEGLLVPSATGAFLVKDLFLLGAAVWTAGEAWSAAGAVAAQRGSDGRSSASIFSSE